MIFKKLIVIVILFLTMNSNAQESRTIDMFKWAQAEPIPDSDGFAGSYAGVSNGALIVAGGSNFPDNKRPWNGGVKTWYDKIFVLESPKGHWKEAGKLPRPMAYGVALTCKAGVLCIGGGDAKQNYRDVFVLSYQSGEIKTTFLPPLPAPLINACGVIDNNSVYIMGGIGTPTGITENNFWSLDLSAAPESQKWEIRENLPGPSRMLATSGSANGNIYVFGGVHLITESDGGLQREYLKDCREYRPGKGWKKINDLPYTLAATPSPAYKAGPSDLLLFGGDDGINALRIPELKDRHPGFRNEILAYNTEKNSWTAAGTVFVDKKADSVTNPHNSVYAPVTTPLVIWRHNIVIAGGEVRPAVRSNKVLMAEPKLK